MVPSDDFDPDFDDHFDEEDDEAFLAAWEEADRHAAFVIDRALAGHDRPTPAPDLIAVAASGLQRRGTLPHTSARWTLRAAGIDTDDTLDPADLVTRAVAATISFVDDPGLPSEQAAAVMSLQHADWVGAIVGAVRTGPGTHLSGPVLTGFAEMVEEVDVEPLDPDETVMIAHAFDLIMPAWRDAGVVDDYDRLTPLGAWLLPRAAMVAWTGQPDPDLSEFDVQDTSVEDLGKDSPSVDANAPAHLPSDGAWRGPLHDDDPFDDSLSGDAERQMSQAAARILAEQGPVTEAHLTGLLLEAGFDAAQIPSDVSRVHGVFPLRDGRVANLRSLADGRVFTHWLTAAEAAEERVQISPDLDLYVTIVPPPFSYVGGGEVDLQMWTGPHDPNRSTSLFGPPGWLAGARGHDLVTVRLDQGSVTVQVIDHDTPDPNESHRVADQLRDTFDALGGVNDMGGPLDVPELLIETLARYPSAFRRPVEPVEVLLEMGDLIEDDSAVVDVDDLDGAEDDWEDGPWDEEDPWEEEDAAEEAVREWLHSAYGLHDVGAQALGLLHAAVHVLANDPPGDPSDELRRNLGTALASEDGVAQALADEVLERHGDGVDDLHRLIDLVDPVATGTGRAPLGLLRARCWEQRGDPVGASGTLVAALKEDPDYAPARELLVDYLEVAGDSAGALRHLRRLRVPGDDTQLQRLTRWARADKVVSRNAACPCGSGRKFKLCHLGKGGPLADRVAWLLEKAVAYAHYPARYGRMVDLVTARAGDTHDDLAVLQAIEDPVVTDVALFEGGLLAQFLAHRGPLLPEDERDLARGWLEVRRGAYEIIEANPGEGLEVLDLRSGDRHSIREQTASTNLSVGEVLFARLLPDGTGLQLGGGTMVIPVQTRPSLLTLLDSDPTAADIWGWIAGFHAPPELYTMEGEPTVLCRAVYRIGDPEAATAALDGRLELEGPGQLVERVQIDGTDWIRGSITITGDALVIEANAEPRLERLQDLVTDRVPDAQLVEEERRSVAEVLAERHASDEPVPGLQDPADLPVEARAALESFIQDHERRWVDEPVPMFGGATPRQALADPTRRGDVVAFLDEMELGPQLPGGMNARRIKDLLGIR